MQVTKIARILQAFVLPLLVVSACTTYRMEHNTLPSTGAKVNYEGGFYVALASDGEYNGKPYPGSGRAVTHAVAAALSKRSLRVEVAPALVSNEEYLRVAREGGLKYLALPTVLHWEDRATEWSGIPDRISIRLAFLDTDTGKITDSAVVSGRSKWATFGGDHPQDLLPGALDQYLHQVP